MAGAARMRPVLLSQVAQWTGGRLLGDDRLVDQLVTDTRTLVAVAPTSALFVALKGERFDGHTHVGDAASAGIRTALVAHEVDAPMSQVIVADTERALAALAAAVQGTRTSKVVAITGSNGKTSVKSLLLGILQHAGNAYANPGNRNNEIGLPLAVIDAPDDADFAIYEMGAGKPGDIAYLASIVPPQVALVNNIAPAHMERMGSLLGIAETKGAIYEALPDDGIAVINADDAFAPFFQQIVGNRRSFRYGIENGGDVRASRILPEAGASRFHLQTPAGSADIHLPLPGQHNVLNALAASALAIAAGAGFDAVVEGLQQAEPVKGRQVAIRLPNGATLIDDSYNANPGSVAAAIATLAQGGGEAWLVLGDMKELGPDGEALHAQVGAQARAARLARLWTVGSLSAAASTAFGADGAHFTSQDELVAALRRALRAHGDRIGLRVLVKGSRSSAMDKVVAALLADGGDGHAA